MPSAALPSRACSRRASLLSVGSDARFSEKVNQLNKLFMVSQEFLSKFLLACSSAALKGQHLPPVLHLRRAWGSLCANRQAFQFGSEFRASGYHRRHAYSRCLCGSHGKSTSAIVCKSRKSSQITTAILDRSSYGYGTEATLSRMSADLDLKPPTRMRCGAFA